MKIAILADIHGNLQALQAVLMDVKREAPDLVVVNGDLVNRGPSNPEVMELLWEKGYIITLGNHDDLVKKFVDHDVELPPHYFTDPFWSGLEWCAKQLDKTGWIHAFRHLPMTYKVEIGNAPTLLISHGSPRHYREGYSPYLSDEALSEILEAYPADILIGSHTHDPMERRWGQHLILNTGAVGAPFNEDVRAHYLIMTLQKNQWDYDFRKLEYDRERALRAYETSGYLREGGLSAAIFKLELENARSYLTPFWMWTEERGEQQTWETWKAFRKTFSERFEK
ncbi:MAG: metallophosphoesterase family protein [Trueperaceae bacterium]